MKIMTILALMTVLITSATFGLELPIEQSLGPDQTYTSPDLGGGVTPQYVYQEIDSRNVTLGGDDDFHSFATFQGVTDHNGFSDAADFVSWNEPCDLYQYNRTYATSSVEYWWVGDDTGSGICKFKTDW